MNLSSPSYIVFLLLVFLLYYAMAPGRPRRLLLLTASYFFYLQVSGAYVLVLLLVTGITYGGALLLRSVKLEHRREALFATILTLALVPLLAFKYLGPFLQVIGGPMPMLQPLSAKLMALAFPVGISFFTFAALGYLIDVYLEVIEPETSFERVALFLSFFPVVTAGPIERGTFMAQFDFDNKFSSQGALAGMRLILIGLTLKSVLAEGLDRPAELLFSGPTNYSSVQNLIGAIDFTFFIYADFAGYSLIAIGSALLFGLRVRPNFQQPFLSVTIPDFWRHWHMSLSFWVRDYIFSPLRTTWRRSGQLGMASALFFSIVIIGVWHGAKWGYLVFGVMHASLVVISSFTLARRDAFWKSIHFPTPLLLFARTLITFFLVTLTFVVFRASSLDDAMTIYGKIFSLGLLTGLARCLSTFSIPPPPFTIPEYTPQYWAWIPILVIIAGDILTRKKITIEKFPLVLQAVLYGLALAKIFGTWIDIYAPHPFVYNQF